MHQSYFVVRAPVFNLAECFSDWVVLHLVNKFLVKPRCTVHCELAAGVLHECAIVFFFCFFIIICFFVCFQERGTCMQFMHA